MGYSVVIPAAGQGKRMKLDQNKQFLLLEGKPIIIHTLEVFESDPWCSEIIVAANHEEIAQFQKLVRSYSFNKMIKIVAGGSERQYSVHNGLKVVKENEIVLIHDGARPFVTVEKIHELVTEAKRTGAAVLAVRVKDTIKSSEENFVTETVDRSKLWSVQTPQAFHVKEIIAAHQWAERTNYIGTDDASLLEQVNGKVSIVNGDYFNIKLTTPEDIVFAKAILSIKRGE